MTTSKRYEIGRQLVLIANEKTVAYGLLIGTDILNSVIAIILLYFTEFDSFAGLLRHSR